MLLMCRVISIAASALFSCITLSSLCGQQRGVDNTARPGRIHDKIVCRHDETQSYALYLPSSYDGRKRCPVLFGFSPGANGRSIPDHFRKAAERFGWIVVGSNNSRNGPASIGEAAGRAMWKDVRARFVVDDGRQYATGMSGGACVAADFAQRMPRPLAGVFLHARGDLQTVPRKAIDTFFLLAPGSTDFNFEESIRFLREARKQRCRAHLEVQPGGHAWASADACVAMLRYAELCHELAGDAGVSARLAKLIDEEIDHLSTKLEGPFFWCGLERLDELTAKVRDRGKRARSIGRRLKRLRAPLQARVAAERAAWEQLERECLFDAALFRRYPSIASVTAVGRARLRLLRDHPGTSASYAVVLAQKNALASLGRILSHKPSAEVQEAYRKYLEKVGTYEFDFVEAAEHLARRRCLGRAMVALLAGFEAGQVNSKSLRRSRLRSLRKRPGFERLKKLVDSGK